MNLLPVTWFAPRSLKAYTNTDECGQTEEMSVIHMKLLGWSYTNQMEVKVNGGVEAISYNCRYTTKCSLEALPITAYSN